MRTRTLFVVAVLASVVSLASAQLSGRPSWAKDPSGWAASSWNEGVALDAVKGYGDVDGDGKPDYYPKEYATREEAHEFAVRYAKWLYEDGHGYTDAQIAAVVGAICAEMERATGTKLDPAKVLAAAQAALQGSAAPTPQPPTGAAPATPPAQPQPAPGAGAPPSGGGATPQPAPMPQPPAPPAGTPPAAGTPAAAPTGTPTGASMVGGLIPTGWSPLQYCGTAAFCALLVVGVVWYQRRRPIRFSGRV